MRAILLRPHSRSSIALRIARCISAIVALVAIGGLGGAQPALAGRCPNVQIVFDRSTAMGNTLDLFSKLAAVQTAAELVLPSYDATMRLGLTAFPKTAAACDVDTSILPTAANSSGVTTAINAYSALGSSSTGSAIRAAASLAALRDPSRPQYIVLITGGSPTCGGTTDTVAGTVNEIRSAYLQSPPVATLVLGIGLLSGTEADALNQMATAGGRPLTGSTKYYAGTNSFGLITVLGNVLTAISNEVGTCSDATGGDMGGPTDMAGPSDLSTPTDLPIGTDLSRPPDLSLPPDLSSRDLSMPPGDLSSGGDLRPPPAGPAPIVDWIDPSQLKFGQGGVANIVGRNFALGSPSAYAYLEGEGNTIPLANAVVLNDGNIQTFISRTLPVGSYDVVVKNPDGQLGRQPNALTILDAPSSGCACSLGGARASGPAPSALAALAALAVLAARRRRRRFSR